ncbi:PIF1-like helicase-domain-containing protein [Lentinula guzmanii]|uniref:ATP-dependent DNA helicase n=1 Tax=Lentinula guzmanii TaxID=2804957 RepID=A0AA38JF89_9AGAR|nr:PIF1-like helicase-domain-containing protein [Lentinula guzmanii]
MQYYVVIGQQGPQIEEVLDEVVPYYFSQAGFSSRHQAEICVKLLETTWRTPPANRYPNSLTHWEESNDPLRSVPSNPLATPSPSPSLANGQTATVNSVPSNQAPRVDAIELSEEQKQVLETVKAGGNVFFTGPAGTGKSVLIREIIKVLRSQGKQVAVTASTGIAGVNIKGSTVHSWAGIGLGKESAEKLSSRISRSIHAKLRWTATDVLIVDESTSYSA